jgi:hypothetical protein
MLVGDRAIGPLLCEANGDAIVFGFPWHPAELEALHARFVLFELANNAWLLLFLRFSDWARDRDGGREEPGVRP